MKNHRHLLFALVITISLFISQNTYASASGLTLITAIPRDNGDTLYIDYTIISSEITASSSYDVALWRNTVSGIDGAVCVYSGTSSGLTGSLTLGTESLPGGIYYVYIVITVNGYSATSNPVLVTVPGDYTAVTTPPPVVNKEVSITKSPSGETVEAGEDAYFIAAAENYSGIEWRIVSINEAECYRGEEEIETRFPGVSVNNWTSEDGREYLHLMYIPALMDGYAVQAKFWSLDGDSTAFTDISNAVINVISPTPSPPVSPSPSPVTVFTETVSPGETALPTVTGTEPQPVRVSQDPSTVKQRQDASVAFGIAALGLITVCCGIYLVLRKNNDNE